MKKYLLPYLFLAILTLLILGPLLAPGHIFLLDMIWPEHFQLSDYTTTGIPSHYPLLLIFATLNAFVPAAVIQKLLLFCILWGASVFMYKLAKNFMPRTHALLAGTLYILNPFVAERLLAGQWLVLAGYAWLPVLFLAIHYGIHSNTKKSWLTTSAVYILYPILSIHWWYIGTFLATLYILTGFRRKPSRTTLVYGCTYLIVFAALHTYWILNVVSNDGQLANFGGDDFLAFATNSDSRFGLLINVLSLYGFWSDDFFLPKNSSTLWPFYGLLMMTLAMIGMHLATKKHTTIRPLARALLITTPIATLVSLGYGSNVTSTLIDILRAAVPGFSGLRETAKVIGVLAFIVALFPPYALSRLPEKSYRKPVLVGFATLLILVMHGQLWGVSGQTKAHNYPFSWHKAQAILDKENATNILTLPWQGYLNLNFADNHFVANPSRVFFRQNIVQSPFSRSRVLDEKNPVGEMFNSWKANHTTTPELYTWLEENYDIDHIIILKTDNWQYYAPLITTEDTLYESEDIAIISLELNGS